MSTIDHASAAWRRLAVSWLDAELAAAGIERIGEVTQPHLRPWGTVLHAPTTSGPVWLKAPGPDNSHEVALYGLMRHAAPEWTLQPIATDVERGWVVLPDGGRTLGDREDLDLAKALENVLPQYGSLQRALLPHTPALLSYGIADMRAAVMPQRFEEALEAAEKYVAQYGDAADREILRRVSAMRATFGAWCERLAAASVPPGLDHNDLHPWNVFLTPTGRATFYDWGDSVVAHPFASMLVGLGFLHANLGLAPDDPAMLRLRDAYLEVFDDLAPRAELVEELELACQVGKVARALTWERAIRAQRERGERSEFARAPLESLGAILSDVHLALGERS